MNAIIVSTWILMGIPWGAGEAPFVYIDNIATKEECERVRQEVLGPSGNTKGYRCFEVKRAVAAKAP